GRDRLDAFARVEGRRRGRLVALVRVGRDDVVRRERRAVGPLHAGAQLPRNGGEVLCDPTVLDGRDLGGEAVRERLAVLVPGRERLEDETGRVGVLGAGRLVRVQDRRSLPIKDVQCL